MSTPTFSAPASIAALGPEVSDQLADLVRAAERRQVQEGLAAVESSLAIVPRPLRPVIKKVLGL